MAKSKLLIRLPLTRGEVEFLLAVMQDYLDVTADPGVRRRARDIKRRLLRVRRNDPKSPL